MNHLKLIIQREYLTKVKNKSFIIMTFLSPIIMVVLISVVVYLSQMNNDTVKHISILDETHSLKESIRDNKLVKYTFLENIDLEAAKSLSEEKGDYGLLHIPQLATISESAKQSKFYSESTPSLSIISDLERLIEKKFTDIILIDKGYDLSEIKSSKVSVNLNQESFEGEKTSKLDNIVKLVFGGAAGYLLFMFIIIYGNMIMRSIIEEKTSRIIEVIISSVKPTQLMMGKILGTSLAGISQFLIWIILGGVLFTVMGSVFGLSSVPDSQGMMNQTANISVNSEIQNLFTAINHLPLTNLAIAFVFFFLGGYLLYSSLYAAIGAAVDNETDTQQFMLPILMPLILAVYVGFFTVIEDPHGTVSTVFSFIPFTSPVVMLMRIPFGVPIWQQIVSVLILIFSFMGSVWLGAKIYRVGILMYGKKPSYKELVKWIKY